MIALEKVQKLRWKFGNNTLQVDKPRIFPRRDRAQPGQIALECSLQVEPHCFEESFSGLLDGVALRGHIQVLAEGNVA
jgi:hypothetical protein